MLVKVRVVRNHIDPDSVLRRPAGRRSPRCPGPAVPPMDAPRDLAPHAARADLPPAPGVRCGGWRDRVL